MQSICWPAERRRHLLHEQRVPATLHAAHHQASFGAAGTTRAPVIMLRFDMYHLDAQLLMVS
jgi:hypothetical protein